MSEIGYNGRALKVLRGGIVIAAVRSKTATHSREPVDVTTDDSNGDRTLLPAPAIRAIDLSVEGVATVDNYQAFLSSWKLDAFLDVSVLHADGSIEEAQEGFFLGNVEFTAEYNGAVMFTAQLMSSGPVTQSLS
jgi:predicted secreted protein